MYQSTSRKEILKKIANQYADEAVRNMNSAVFRYTEDVKSGKYSLEEIQVVVSLTDIYYSVKTGVMSREEAKEKQQIVLESIN